MAPKRATPFRTEHALQFGVKVVERDAATKEVVSTSCLFCIHFGREENIGSKRSRTANVMYFKKPFRSDMYLRHMTSQHPLRWNEYSALNQTEKASYFDANAPVVHPNTIKSYFGGSQVPIQLLVDKDIVDVIIGDMLFQDDDNNEEITKERALSIFEDILDPSEGNRDGCDDAADVSTARYRIHLKNPAQVYLICDYLSVGASLEGLTTIVAQQLEGLRRLHDVYARLLKASGPLSMEEAMAVDRAIAVVSEYQKYSLKISNVEAVLEDLGLFVAGKIEETGAEAMAELLKSLAVCTVNLIAGVISIVAERDSSNEAATEMPPVLPHQLVMLRGREFSEILKVQTPRLRTTCSITEIDIIEQEFAELQSAYHRERCFKAVLDACGPHTSFDEGWKLTQDRFCSLREFCGGLATAFPGTSTVESDFSIVKWEKDVGRASLTNFSLEGILHAKQFKQMRSINFK
ncbi:unnamed protein product [Sphagnum troendelagicum]|uniref:HAT C-terminal dimerisation domain-containing protein n=1 Tax=Sphagnum troendelagicum TaxID=128251 RepID=A0ABP0TZH6_9BRYO